MVDPVDLARRLQSVELVGDRHERLAEGGGELLRRPRSSSVQVGEQREQLAGQAAAPELAADQPVDVLADRPELDQVEPRELAGVSVAVRRSVACGTGEDITVP